MSYSSRFGSSRISVGRRLLLLGFGSALLGLLAVAAMLSPDPRGYGTHERMGLPPCTFQAMFQIRCPSCGMTTAWAHAVRGRLDRAVRANAGGAGLTLLAALVGPWCLASGIRGRWWVAAPSDRVVLAVCLVVFTLTLVDWAIRFFLALWS